MGYRGKMNNKLVNIDIEEKNEKGESTIEVKQEKL